MVAEEEIESAIPFGCVMSAVSIPRLVPANSKKKNNHKIDSDVYYCFQCPSDNIDTIYF